MMFDILKVKTFQGDEYKVCGDEKDVHLEWRQAPPRENNSWEILYFKALLDDGVESCIRQLRAELRDLMLGTRMIDSADEFIKQAYMMCIKTPHES
jgi:hypothetical protein